jgi:sulfite reductase (NADPH) hemoprotein beta-component
MAAGSPHRSRVHAELHQLAQAVSAHLRPRTSAYAEIWYDEQPSGPDHEPLYGPTYLPRKFKIGFAVPPVNDIDVYAQDLGFIAILEEGRLAGFNVTVGGGMGRTDNAPHTYPRVGDVIGFVTPDQVLAVAEHTVAIQRDYGDRVDRLHARFKYTIDDRGTEWFAAELALRSGCALEPARAFRFECNTDEFGWVQSEDGLWHCTLFVLNGRIKDDATTRVRSALRAIAAMHDGEFRLTPNQNVIIARVRASERARIEQLLAEHGIQAERSLLQRNAISCVALPTCALAMAESERYLPALIDKIEALMHASGVADQPLTIRMSGCPNGCSRPYIAEIGFTGRAPGKYNMYLGGGAHGQRLNKMYLENVGEERILAALGEIFGRYARERHAGEPFGDFVIRAGIVAEVKAGRDFNT